MAILGAGRGHFQWHIKSVSLRKIERSDMSTSDNFAETWSKIDALMATGNTAHFIEATDLAVEHLPSSLSRALVRSLCLHSDCMIRDDAVELLAEIGEDEDLWCFLVMSRDPH